MRYSRILFCFFLSTGLSFGQQDALNDLVGKLQTSFTKVETAAFSYEQEIKLVEYSSLNYSYKQTDLKGIGTSFSCDFNLADIDPYAAREETQKDLIFVVLNARNKQRLFKTVKDGKTQPFDDELKIHARDIDHARAILDIIKKAIPIGEKISNGKLKLEGYDNMRTWLEEHIGKVSDGTRMFDQTLKEESFPASFRLLQISSDGKSSHQEEYRFNVADINLNTLIFKISGNSFGLEFFMMERLKSIGFQRDGVVKAFEDKVVIFTNGVDEARDIRTVLTLINPLALAKVKADNPGAANMAAALDNMVTLVKDVKINNVTYAQKMTASCVTSVSIGQQSASSAVNNTYDFNWMDVNPNLVRLQVSGEKMELLLPMMDKKKVVMQSKDGKLLGYESDLSIYVEDIEVGRRLRYLTDKTIGFCKAAYHDPFPAETGGMVTWIREAVTDVAIEQVTTKQVIELVEEGNFNKLKFTSVEMKASSSVQEVFEFNLSDVNPNSVDYYISGKSLRVKFETNFKNKIIKAYKDGKIMPYVYNLEIVMKDIESARGLIAALKKCAENLKEK